MHGKKPGLLTEKCSSLDRIRDMMVEVTSAAATISQPEEAKAASSDEEPGNGTN